jgi:hypothetical protein
MLGNDVVDLLDVDARPETFRRRFDERVFSAEERLALVEDAEDASAARRSHALRWAHWAAKEAAYKLIRQVDPTFVFSPGRLVACFEPMPHRPTDRASASRSTFERRGRLEVVGGSAPLAAPLSLRSFEGEDFVHVVALPADGDWNAVAMAVEAGPPPSGAASFVAESEAAAGVRPAAAPGAERVAEAGRASAAVRRLALQSLARELEVDVARLAIGRRGRIPTVELDGRTLPVSLSLSHHGRFVAFAASPRGRAALEASAAAGDERAEQRGATEPFGAKAGSADGLRQASRVRTASVRRASVEGGGPFASADTAWMVG